MQALNALKSRLLDLAIRGKLVPQIDGENEVEQIGKAPKENPFEIPKKWKWVRLDDIAPYGKCERIEACSFDRDTWLLNLEDIEKDTGRLLQKNKIIKNQGAKYLFNKGDVLYSRLRPYLNKVLVADEDGVCTTEIIPLKPKENTLSGSYLSFFLKSQYFVQYAVSQSYGVKMPRVGTATAKNALVALPPLDEQKRIVEKLESLFAKIDTIQKSIDEVSQLGASLEKQLLQSSISGKLVPQLDEELEVEQIGDAPEEVPFEIPEKWKWVRLESLGTLFSGKTPKADELTSSGNIPYFKISDMNSSENQKYMRHTEHYLKTTPKKIFKAGSIIFPKNGGAVFTNKRRFLVRDSIVDLNTGGFYPNKNYLDESYAFLLLSSIDFREIPKGTALPTIDSSKLKSYLVPLPPLGEQRRIVEKFEKLMLEIQKLK